MKIAIISGIFFPDPGGAQIQSHNFSNKLVDMGHEVDSYIFNSTNIKINNYNIFVINKFLSSLVFFFEYYLSIDISIILKIYLKKIISKNKYDIWHLNFINYKSLIIINTLKKLDQKVVVTFQGVDIQIDKSINYGYRLDKKYDKYLLKTIKNIDLFLNISKTIENDLKKIGVNGDKIIFLPNTVDTKKFRNKYNLNKISTNKKLRLITVARFAEKKKGYDLLPILAQKLLENNITFIWTIIGQHATKLLKNDFIDKNKDSFNIIENINNDNEEYFPHSTIIDKYINSDLYINLARIESFGITFIEAMASGLPVITFNSKGANEIVIDNYNGYLIKSNNLDSYVKKIKDIDNNKAIMKLTKDNVFKSAEKYDLELTTIKLIKTYEKLL
ncbi:glycosyltransferase family 4 protein [Candidatus Pelagibacter sp.]|nr:glycosyltransferase family 4 protein [Candidatus Pelagibacter sp.]